MGDVVPYIGVQFYFNQNGAYGTVPTQALQPTDSAGELPQEHFNTIATPSGAFYAQAGTNISLNDAGGNSTPVQLTYSSGASWENASGSMTPNQELQQAELKTTGAGNTATITLSGVNAGTYDLLAYIANDDNNLVQAAYTVGATTYYANEQAGVSNTFTQADGLTTDAPITGNYVEFDNISVPTNNGTITLTYEAYESTDGNNGAAAVNGLQLAQVVPEPASASVIGLGALLFLRRRSRRAAR
jgi:hypothetical protein